MELPPYFRAILRKGRAWGRWYIHKEVPTAVREDIRQKKKLNVRRALSTISIF